MNTRLKRVATLAAGGTPAVDNPDFWAADDGVGLPWVSIGDMSDGRPVTTTGRRVTPAGLADKRLPVGEPGTLLFAMYASVGAVGTLATRATWNQALLGVRPRPNVSDSRFLRHWLEHLRPTLGALSRSNTQDNLNADQVGNLPFPALPIANQRAIGDYLDVETARIDTLIAKKQRLIGRLQLRFEYLTEESVFPTSASRTRLDRLTNPARRIMYGIVLPGPDVGEGAPIVKGGNVRDHRIGGHVCHTTDEIESGYVRSRLAPGDLVVIIRGAGAGRVAVVTEENAGWNITQDVARVSPGARTSTEWLRLVLESRPVQEQLRVRVGGAAITGINIWDLQRLEVPDVPLGEQRRVAEAVGDAERAHELLVRTLHRQIDLLAEHRQALITAAVTGELEMAGLA